MRKPRNKVERLVVAGAVATSLRSNHERLARRRIYRVDGEGKVVGVTSADVVARSVLARKRIEIDVIDGQRPSEVMCNACGLPFVVENRRGAIRRRCKPCERLDAKERSLAAKGREPRPPRCEVDVKRARQLLRGGMSRIKVAQELCISPSTLARALRYAWSVSVSLGTKAGIARARAQGTRIGRPSRELDVRRARELIASGLSTAATARELRVSGSTLARALRRRIVDDTGPFR
jgi:AraC-like DNA-binding protein